MLKKTIKFLDVDGNQLEEDFYFNISKAEFAEMEIGEAKHGGLSALIEKIVEEQDGKRIMELLNEIIKTAYGKKSSDGRKFIKSQEVWEDFYYTDAHSELLFEFYTNPDSLVDFLRGAAPTEIQQKMEDVDFENMSAEEIRAKAKEQMKGHQPKKAVEKKSADKPKTD